jgi:polysaccharide pyruvyl transferase WcaK-like protein
MPLREGYDVYRAASLVVGMRGHATMIPFGLGTPVLSIISHPKMKYFLDDIERPQWGFDVHDPSLAGSLLDRTMDVLDTEAHYRADIAGIQRTLLEVIQLQLRTMPVFDVAAS